MRSAPPSSATPQPSVRNASIITRVSSESSRSWTQVLPSARPASSSTRLEMLFEPGRRTVPAARCNGGRSRKRVVNIVRQPAAVESPAGLPLAAAVGCDADQVFEGGVIGAAQHVLEGVERVPEAHRLLQDLLAIGRQDVAPDCRIAGRDAREIAEAGATHAQEIGARRLPQQRIEIGECQQVRQMADRGEAAS